jgi:hypothetical protein
MLRDKLSSTLNPTIGHSIEKFLGSSSKKTTITTYTTHLVCLVQEILHEGSLMHVPQPPRIGDVVINQQASKKLPQASRQLHASSF